MSTQTLIDINSIREWATEAGKIALSQSADRRVNLKEDRTPVTEIDRKVESFLLERIESQYPGHAVLAEEGSTRSGSDFTWIIDPIDGTRAYASGLPIWGISIGVFYLGEPYAGVFYLPMTGETYWGMREEAFYNDRKLIPQPTVDIYSPLAFIAVPSNVHRHFEVSFPRIRSLGSAAAHLAYVAYGSATAALTRRIRIWDMAAVLSSFKSANIEMTYLNGEPFHTQDLMHGEAAPQPLLAAHASVIEEIRKCIKTKTGDLPAND